jgi:hypothetical protein
MADQQQPRPRLIVVAAFDLDAEGELQSVEGYPAEQQSEDRAKRIAKGLAGKHAGVIAWSREANPQIGEYGEPTILFTYGQVPDME